MSGNRRVFLKTWWSGYLGEVRPFHDNYIYAYNSGCTFSGQSVYSLLGPTPSPTATQMTTPTLTTTPTATPDVTTTPSPTPDVTSTPTSSPAITPSATETPTVTPTFTPTASLTPSVTPTMTQTSTPFAACPEQLEFTSSFYSTNSGTYYRLRNYTGGTFDYGYFNETSSNNGVFQPSQLLGGNAFSVFGRQSGSTYFTMMRRTVSLPQTWKVFVSTGDYIINGGTPVSGQSFNVNVGINDGGIYFPPNGFGTSNFSYLSYPSVCPTSTPTPSVTATLTSTPSITPSTTPTGTASVTPTPSPTAAGLDPDAVNYLNALVVSGGTGITPTISAATNTMFVSLKNAGLYNKIYALYPYLGGNSSGCRFNAKNPIVTDAAFRQTFVGGVTFGPLGVKWDGTSGNGVTYFNPQTQSVPYTSYTLFNYVTISGASGYELGCAASSIFAGLSASNGGNALGEIARSQSGNILEASNVPYGFFAITRNGSTANISYVANGGAVTSKAQATQATLLPNTNVLTGVYGGVGFRSNKGSGTDGIAQGLSDSELASLRDIITTFNTAIGR